MAVNPPKITTPAFVLKYNFIHTLGDAQKVGTAMYFLYTTSGARPTQANLLSLATTAGTAWNTNCASLFTTNGVLSGVSVQDIYDTSGAFGLQAVSHNGSRSGAQPVTFACANVNYQVAAHFRGGKFKGFWPFGIASDAPLQTDWGASFITAVDTGVTALSAAIDGSTAGPITVGAQQGVSFFSGAESNSNSSVWAPRNKPKPRSTAQLYPVTGWQCGTKIASQRRRRQ